MTRWKVTGTLACTHVQKKARIDRVRIHDPAEEIWLRVVTLPGRSG
jgi:hypothetical protein